MMTKRAATGGGGQSLLISGALKMARGKRPPNNINPNHELTLIGNAREMQAVLEHQRSNHHHHHHHLHHHHLLGNSNNLRHHLHEHNESASNSSNESMSGFVSPSSPLQHPPQDQSPIMGPAKTKTSNNNINNNNSSSSSITMHQTIAKNLAASKTVAQQQALHLHKQHNSSSSSSSSSNNSSSSNSNDNNNEQLFEGKNKKLFPQKLWDLINDERYSFCLRWSEDGQLVYLNRDEFEDSYLKTAENQFHTQKAISFVRQMNMYGFRKVDDCCYENDNFKRGCEHLLKNMSRKHPNKQNGVNQSVGSAATTTTTTTTTSGIATGGPNELSSYLYHKSIAGNAVSSRPVGLAHSTNNPLISLFNGGGLGEPTAIAGAPARGSPKKAHNAVNALQSSDLQPVDLRCAIQQSHNQRARGSGAGEPMQAFNSNTPTTNNNSSQNGQDLSRLLESLVAMSQANLLETSLRQLQEQQMGIGGCGVDAAAAIAAQIALLSQQTLASDEPMMGIESTGAAAVSNFERSIRASNESQLESISPTPIVTPPPSQADPTSIHINLNMGNRQNNLTNMQAAQEQPLPLTSPAVTAVGREQQFLNTLQLFRLMLEFSNQQPATS